MTYPQDISIYTDSVKLLIESVEEKIVLKKGEIREGKEVYASPLIISVEKEKLSQKGEIEIRFEGYSHEGFCYLPQTHRLPCNFTDSLFSDKSLFFHPRKFFYFWTSFKSDPLRVSNDPYFIGNSFKDLTHECQKRIFTFTGVCLKYECRLYDSGSFSRTFWK